MNIKYNQLSVIGKIWTLAQTFSAGIIDDKNAYINSVLNHLEDLIKDVNANNSSAVDENSFESIFENATDIWCGSESITSVDDGIVSTIWKNRLEYDQIKRKAKENFLTKADKLQLMDLYLEIKHIWIKDLKERKLSSLERRDIFKIKEEIEDLKIKIENRINRNQINLI